MWAGVLMDQLSRPRLAASAFWAAWASSFSLFSVVAVAVPPSRVGWPLDELGGPSVVRFGQPHGLWCVGIKNELNATKGPALLQPRRRRVLRAGDEGRGVSEVNPGWPWRAEGERKRGVDMSAQRVHMQAPNRGGYPIWVR